MAQGSHRHFLPGRPCHYRYSQVTGSPLPDLRQVHDCRSRWGSSLENTQEARSSHAEGSRVALRRVAHAASKLGCFLGPAKHGLLTAKRRLERNRFNSMPSIVVHSLSLLPFETMSSVTFMTLKSPKSATFSTEHRVPHGPSRRSSWIRDGPCSGRLSCRSKHAVTSQPRPPVSDTQ